VVHHPERLAKVDLRLVDVVMKVGESRDVLVLEGARSKEDEQKAIDSGHSSLTDPMDSKHVIDSISRPLALAVDLAPVPLIWTDLAAFDGLAADVKIAAQALGIVVTWGGDWVHFKDRPHFQVGD
jgi:peptidoglycan L-alanyl-D-glutamate endopeptidase CwlK